MNSKDEKFIRFWKKRSEGGKVRFSVTSVLFAVVIAVVTEYGYRLFPNTPAVTIKSLLTRVVIYSVMGFLMGRWYWGSNEKRYQELIKNQ